MNKQYRLHDDEFELITNLRNANRENLLLCRLLLIDEAYETRMSKVQGILTDIEDLKNALSVLKKGESIQDINQLKKIFRSYISTKRFLSNEEIDDLMNYPENWDDAIRNAQEYVGNEISTAEFYSSLSRTLKKLSDLKLHNEDSYED